MEVQWLIPCNNVTHLYAADQQQRWVFWGEWFARRKKTTSQRVSFSYAISFLFFKFCCLREYGLQQNTINISLNPGSHLHINEHSQTFIQSLTSCMECFVILSRLNLSSQYTSQLFLWTCDPCGINMWTRVCLLWIVGLVLTCVASASVLTFICSLVTFPFASVWRNPVCQIASHPWAWFTKSIELIPIHSKKVHLNIIRWRAVQWKLLFRY